MTAKFTAGPWLLKTEGGDLHIIADRESIMCNMNYYPWTPHNHHDWDLIAAAPELYEALEAAIELLASAEIQSSVRVKGMTKVVRDGYKALKKSRGES